MFELIRTGGWLMLPILVCSVLSVAIILERSLALRRAVVTPSRHYPGTLSSAAPCRGDAFRLGH